MIMWLAILCVLALVTGLMSFGIIPTAATGLVHILLGIYLGLLALSLVIGAIRG